MAIAFVKDFSGSDTDASVPATVPGGGVAAGNLLIVSVTIGADGTSLSTVTDTKSNSYTVITTLHGSGENQSAGLAWSVISNALVSGDVVTGNLSGADGGSNVCAEYSGLTATPDDKHAEQVTAFGTTHTSGATATTTQADELVFGFISLMATTTAWTPDASYGTADEDQTFFGSWRHVNQHKIVSATGAYEANGTSAGNCRTLAFVATFKADTGVPVGNIAWIKA